MQTQTDLERIFCYKCNLKSSSNLYCTRCGNSDLIPEPMIAIDMTPESRKPEMIAFEAEDLFGTEEEKQHKGIDFSKIKLHPAQEEFIDKLEKSIDPSVISKATGKPSFVIETETGQVSHEHPNISNPPVVEVTKPKIDIDPNILEQLKKPFAFVTGPAGTGKTTLIKYMAELYPNYIELCSTTGIAAINLGGRTVHSTLKYFNTKSLRQNYESDKLQWALRKIRKHKQNLGIEECSMLDADQLDIIIAAVDEINNDRSGRTLGVHLIGDLCQLPPVKAPFVFKSKYWDRFADNTVKLNKIWRQDNPDFINAINKIRAGDGKNAVFGLMDCGVKFEKKVNNDFDGTTLIPLNDGVDRYNTTRLNKLTTPMIRTVPNKYGIQLKEWEKLIPDELRLKVGAYVMILSNDVPEFTYVNGDCGVIEDYNKEKDSFQIRLVRNNEIVNIGRIWRKNLTDQYPNPNNFRGNFSPTVDPITGDWIIGIINYHPIRLAYASSIHKSQGLSLDKVQIDTSANFFSFPGMAYVAISRCRTPEGLILVGNPNDIANKIVTDKEILKYV